jgi:hypothetical protein
MLTDLDAELFPDDCEVVEIPSHDRRIYLIQKNGSSSLRKAAASQNWTILQNHEIGSLESVDVYLRDPQERYLSGVNTFVQHLLRDHPGLDHGTCLSLATRYLFLNRHYLPQWHWLINLARFLHPNCQIRLRSLADLDQITDIKSRAGIVPLSSDEAKHLFYNNDKLEFWFLMDRILLGRCGQSLTWQELVQVYKKHPSNPLSNIVDRMESVRHVLR